MYVVAPLVGAWIEIIDTLIENDPEPQSLPSWERGLKLQSRGLHNEKMPSLPSWERGLKSSEPASTPVPDTVAPLVGAWIEIYSASLLPLQSIVAPLVGAWIEICFVR